MVPDFTQFQILNCAEVFLICTKPKVFLENKMRCKLYKQKKLDTKMNKIESLTNYFNPKTNSSVIKHFSHTEMNGNLPIYSGYESFARLGIIIEIGEAIFLTSKIYQKFFKKNINLFLKK